MRRSAPPPEALLLERAGPARLVGADEIRPASWLRAVYRRWRPIPRSPEPKGPDDEHALQLIPAAALTRRLAWAAGYLAQRLDTGIGAYVEFGVYNGSSMICMLEALRRANDPPIRLFGFDSFQGLPPSAAEEDGGVWRPGQFRCPREKAEARIKAAGGGDRVTLVEGWYSDTLSKGDRYGIGRASIVMVDSDTYSSARLALDFVGPLLTNPAVLIFDDWRLNDLDIRGMGEYRAFGEWRLRYPRLRARRLPSYNRKSRMLLLYAA